MQKSSGIIARVVTPGLTSLPVASIPAAVKTRLGRSSRKVTGTGRYAIIGNLVDVCGCVDTSSISKPKPHFHAACPHWGAYSAKEPLIVLPNGMLCLRFSLAPRVRSTVKNPSWGLALLLHVPARILAASRVFKKAPSLVAECSAVMHECGAARRFSIVSAGTPIQMPS